MTYSCASSFTTMSSIRTPSLISLYSDPDPFINFSGVYGGGFDDDQGEPCSASSSSDSDNDSFLSTFDDGTSEHRGEDEFEPEPTLATRLQNVRGLGRKRRLRERLERVRAWLRGVLRCGR
jgi:hypothetical protein